MSRDDRALRQARLNEAAAQRTDDATARARRALMSLRARDAVINFNTVAAEAGVSKTFLYSNPALRAEVQTSRLPSREWAEAPRASARSQETQLKVVVATLTALRTENTQLRRELEVLRGELIKLRRTALPARQD